MLRWLTTASLSLGAWWASSPAAIANSRSISLTEPSPLHLTEVSWKRSTDKLEDDLSGVTNHQEFLIFVSDEQGLIYVFKPSEAGGFRFVQSFDLVCRPGNNG
jgi:hypothetical protein